MTVVTYPFGELSGMDNKRLLNIWAALNQSQNCCARHAVYGEEPDIDALSKWMESVLAEVERRNLPTIIEQEQFSCPTCGGALEAVSGSYDEMYAVCNACGTYRQYGDHMDCSFGPLRELPLPACQH